MYCWTKKTTSPSIKLLVVLVLLEKSNDTSIKFTLKTNVWMQCEFHWRRWIWSSQSQAIKHVILWSVYQRSVKGSRSKTLCELLAIPGEQITNCQLIFWNCKRSPILCIEAWMHTVLFIIKITKTRKVYTKIIQVKVTKQLHRAQGWHSIAS
jgi:hypothetical protein